MRISTPTIKKPVLSSSAAHISSTSNLTQTSLSSQLDNKDITTNQNKNNTSNTDDIHSCVFEVLFLFWFEVMYLLSSWYEMDVLVELLADDIWAAEDDKAYFLSVGVDSFDQWYLKKRPISLTMVQMSTIKRKDEKWR